MAQITRDTIIGDILDIDRTTAPYFLEIGMHCLGCPSARGETLEQACEVHGVEVDALLEKLNAHLASKEYIQNRYPLHLRGVSLLSTRESNLCV